MPVSTTTKWLRAQSPIGIGHRGPSNYIGVDRDNNRINGFIVAQLGPFKSDGRGEFDRKALETIVELGNKKPGGLKMHLAHETLSADGIGTFLGRATNFRTTIASVTHNDAPIDVLAVRADAEIDKTALSQTPKCSSPPGVYIMNLTESDPEALSSSLVLKADEEYRLNSDGTPQRDPVTDNVLPPLWFPTELHGCDIVSAGDATDSMLDFEGLRDGDVRQACRLLNQFLPNASRDVLRTRLAAWLERYLNLRFGGPGVSGASDVTDLVTIVQHRSADQCNSLVRLRDFLKAR